MYSEYSTVLHGWSIPYLLYSINDDRTLVQAGKVKYVDNVLRHVLRSMYVIRLSKSSSRVISVSTYYLEVLVDVP